ncbi:hypothetical protein [Limnohabitans sp. JirII-31]|uniref:hypothetical protein n=1 Tax=Limnohabitans sp. JirII-31 TaxID=1977908 RepID=UPI00117B42BF|nr:hypothetical protein [Limnohabitans sp. JirII-31]
MSNNTTPHANLAILRCAFAQEMVLAKRQRGYSSLVELAITLVVVAFIAIFARGKVLQDMDDSAAAATGAYMVAASVGLQRYLILNVSGLTAYANTASLTPTLAALQAATLDGVPLIATTFASLSPTGQELRFDITRASPCSSGQTCAIVQATACLKTALSVRGQVRDDLATQAMMSMNGMGGRSFAGSAGYINGPTLATNTVTNPVTNTAGILCAVYNTNTFYNFFARTSESRTLNFSGPLNTTGAVTATGTFTATGTVDASNGTLVIPAVTASATCSTSGAMGWVSSGSSYLPARCSGTTWVATGGGLPISTAGTTCTTAGTLAATAAGATLICQGTTLAYVDFVSRMGSLVAMESLIVSNGSTVTKPTCAVAGVNSAIYLFPVTDVQTNQIVYRSATDNTTSWSISILDANGNAIQGDALAMTYCVY